MRNWMLALVFAIGAPSIAMAESKDGKATAGPGNMMHCPTAVPGAKVEIKDIKDGLEVIVAGATDAAQAEIRKRAQHVVEAAKTDPNSVRHTGDGHGGGGIGRCVVVLKDTLITAEDIKGGSKLTVRPVKPVDLEWLRHETAARLAANKK